MADQSEPPIFALVRLRVAEKHFSTIKEKLSEEERVILANNLPFLQEINRRIAILNLECRIVCSEHRTWQYSFRFFDKRRGRNLDDINSLSAGQKAIIHLVFESYGKGELRGGVVIIDEPEVHLHYQFQSEYLRVVGDLHKNEKCQYIIVTHSEALINSETINFTSRFYLDDDGYTKIKSAQSDPDFESLIKILDNTRSTYAFFAKTVALVEGETDRYFFKAVIQRLHGEASQMIAVLDINGKPNFERWAGFFSKFGLRVFQVADFDYIIQRAYPQEKQKKMIRKKVIDDFKANHSDWEEKVDLQKASNLFILKEGGLENYIDVPSKGLVHVVAFCNKRLGLFLESGSKKSQEIRDIARAICG